jgi:hypothetical protein
MSRLMGMKSSLFAAFLAGGLVGCGDDIERPPAQPDATPPATVGNLEVALIGRREVTLRWTAPGDDGPYGTASEYDIRCLDRPLVDSTWASALQVPWTLSPRSGGDAQACTVHGLVPGTDYWFGLKARDESGNWSGRSNVAQGRTSTRGWSSLGGGVHPSTWYVTGMCAATFRGDLIVGGTFDRAGDVPAQNIARWDGTAWHAMGAGIPAGVTALGVYGQELVVAYESSPDNLAAWDGQAWRNLTAAPFTARELIEHEGDLVGLSITLYGGISAIMCLAGPCSHSYSIPGPVNGISTLGLHQGQLVAGVAYTKGYGYEPDFAVTRFDGANWNVLGFWPGLNAPVRLVTVGEDLVGGTRGGLISVMHWTGGAWVPYGPAVTASVLDLAAEGNDLYCGEWDPLLNGMRVSRLSGGAWQELGPCLGDTGVRIFAYGGTVVATGTATVVDGDTLNRVGIWQGDAARLTPPANAL